MIMMMRVVVALSFREDFLALLLVEAGMDVLVIVIMIERRQIFLLPLVDILDVGRFVVVVDSTTEAWRSSRVSTNRHLI